MKIRARVVASIVVSAIVMTVILTVGLSLVFNHEFSDLENDQMQENLKRIQYAIDNEEISLNKQAVIWAAWDDAYRFVIDGNQEFIDTNFVPPTFLNSEINIYAVVNNAGQLVHGENFNLLSQEQVPLTESLQQALSSEALMCRDIEKGKIGILRTDEGPLLVGTAPIVTSKGEGPVNGTLIMGRFFDNELIQKLSFITKLQISFDQLGNVPGSDSTETVPALSMEDPVWIQPLNAEILAGYTLVTDIDGKPYLAAGTQIERDIFSVGKILNWWLLGGTIVTSVIMCWLGVNFLDRVVISRLRLLSRFVTGVSEKSDFSQRVNLSGKDELTELADDTNAMLDRLTEANEKLQESEARYSTLVENSSDGIILLRGDKVTYVNPRMLQMLGMTREEYLGRHHLSIVNPRYRNMIHEIDDLRLKGTPAPGHHEVELDRKDGTCFPVEVVAKTVQLKQQDRQMVVFRDITERKQAEKAQAELLQKEKAHRQDLEEEARTRTQFINVLAHELRTPLTPIMVSLEMLCDTLSTDPKCLQNRMVKNAMDGVETLRGRLEELLDLVRFSRGGFTIKPAAINTGEFLQDVARRYSPVLSNKQQELVIDLPESLPQIEADSSRLDQVLVNLLSNASKYSPVGTKITLRAFETTDGIQVEVQDQGIGIPKEDVDKIFTAYYRAQRDRQKYPGVGLGLTVCKQIIEAHQGRIWVESGPVQGSVFKFILPLKQKMPAPSASPDIAVDVSKP